jgi:tetratricopeptide (TPR) repeat protein
MVIEARRATPGADTKASAERYLRIRLSGGRAIAKPAEHLAVMGRRLLERGDEVHGRRLLEEALRRDPTFVSPYNLLARLAWERGDTAGAIARLESAVAVDADSWRTHRNLGVMLLQLERPAAAETHLRRAVELFAEDVGARVALGRALYAQGKLADYAEQTRGALQVASGLGEPLADVRAFLEESRRRRPGRALPPINMPRVALGWSAD